MRAHINIFPFPLLIGGPEVKRFGYPGLDAMLVVLGRKPGKEHAPRLILYWLWFANDFSFDCFKIFISSVLELLLVLCLLYLNQGRIQTAAIAAQAVVNFGKNFFSGPIPSKIVFFSKLLPYIFKFNLSFVLLR